MMFQVPSGFSSPSGSLILSIDPTNPPPPPRPQRSSNTHDLQLPTTIGGIGYDGTLFPRELFMPSLESDHTKFERNARLPARVLKQRRRDGSLRRTISAAREPMVAMEAVQPWGSMDDNEQRRKSGIPYLDPDWANKLSQSLADQQADQAENTSIVRSCFSSLSVKPSSNKRHCVRRRSSCSNLIFHLPERY